MWGIRGAGRGRDFVDIVNKIPPPRGAKRPGGAAESDARGTFKGLLLTMIGEEGVEETP